MILTLEHLYSFMAYFERNYNLLCKMFSCNFIQIYSSDDTFYIVQFATFSRQTFPHFKQISPPTVFDPLIIFKALFCIAHIYANSICAPQYILVEIYWTICFKFDLCTCITSQKHWKMLTLNKSKMFYRKPLFFHIFLKS